MKLFQWLGTHFNWVFLLALLAAVLLPVDYAWLQKLVMPELMVVIFLSLLKVDMKEVWKLIRRPGILVYALIVSMIVVPIVSFYVFGLVDEQWALGFLLLGAVPAAMASPALTHLFKGKVEFTLPMTVIGHLIVPFTLVGLLSVLSSTSVDFPLGEMFLDLVLIIFIPLLLAELFKKFAPKQVQQLQAYTSGLVVLLICFFVYIVISPQMDLIKSDPTLSLWGLAAVFIYMSVLHLLGYLMMWGRSHKERIAGVVSMAYMNNGLAIVIAFEWFAPEVVLLVVLSEIPWMVLPGFTKWFIRSFKK